MLGLGSNLSDPVAQLQRAVQEIDALPNCRLLKMSSLYESAPIGGVEQPAFVNAVAEIETTLAPTELMSALLAIERAHDRVREVKNGPRTLDLDILLFGDLQLDLEAVTTPHPRAHQRAFVLLPLLEIAPDLTIPGRGAARDYLASVSGQLVHRIAETKRQAH
jgi:2-amino-4-hydroxy-6-hydroxymethyldihydropteridine diphosphokinase